MWITKSTIRTKDPRVFNQGPLLPHPKDGAAVMVAKIATGEIEDELTDDGKNKAAVELGQKGGRARAKKLSKKRRANIARDAAKARWSKRR